MSDLQPSTGGGAEIDADAGILQKSELSVQLNQFKGGSRSVAGFLGEFIKLILTRLSGLHFLPHDEASSTLTALVREEKNKFCKASADSK